MKRAIAILSFILLSLGSTVARKNLQTRESAAAHRWLSSRCVAKRAPNWEETKRQSDGARTVADELCESLIERGNAVLAVV